MRRGRRAGIVLLEVVLSISMVFAMAGVLFLGVDSSVRSARRLRLDAQAADLAVTLLSEIQMGLVDPADAGPEAYEEPLEDWMWEIVTTPLEEMPLDEQDIEQVEIIISHVDGSSTYRLVQLMAVAPQEEEDLPPEDEDAFGGQL